jgi:hypothetical protein
MLAKEIIGVVRAPEKLHSSEISKALGKSHAVHATLKERGLRVLVKGEAAGRPGKVGRDGCPYATTCGEDGEVGIDKILPDEMQSLDCVMNMQTNENMGTIQNAVAVFLDLDRFQCEMSRSFRIGKVVTHEGEIHLVESCRGILGVEWTVPQVLRAGYSQG